MISFLNAKFDKLGAKKFKYFGPLLCFSSDLILLYYIKEYLLSQLITKGALLGYSNMVKNTLIRMQYPVHNLNINSIPSHELDSLLGLGQSLMTTFLVIVISYNFVMYLCSLKYKWAKNYVLFYALSATILSVGEIIGYLFHNFTLNPYTLITTIMYALVYLGFKHFKETEV